MYPKGNTKSTDLGKNDQNIGSIDVLNKQQKDNNKNIEDKNDSDLGYFDSYDEEDLLNRQNFILKHLEELSSNSAKNKNRKVLETPKAYLDSLMKESQSVRNSPKIKPLPIKDTPIKSSKANWGFAGIIKK
jgi:hypothetical protein